MECGWKSVKRNRRLSKRQVSSPLIRVFKRDIGHKRALILYVAAGGRCEFWGCKKYLLKHSVILSTDNFGEIAHIVAFREKGPRGKIQPRPKYLHDLANLMLLCNECHKLVDRQPDEYPPELLREYKQQHEEDVYQATGIRCSQKTAIVRLEAPIDGNQASIPLQQIYKAIHPRHPLENPKCLIELNQQSLISAQPEFMAAASKTVEAEIKDFLTRGLPSERIEHISIFALAPIPLLMVLGYQLGSTIPADIYHHHHDTEDWTWKADPRSITFEHKLLRAGTVPNCVALLISISGTVVLSNLPSDIDDRFYVYQLSPRERKPSTNCLRTREDLENFKRAYEDCLRDLRRAHHQLMAIHLFPAVPPPIAIVCGREVMPKVDPALRIYDFDKKQGGFRFSLEVNANDS